MPRDSASGRGQVTISKISSAHTGCKTTQDQGPTKPEFNKQEIEDKEKLSETTSDHQLYHPR